MLPESPLAIRTRQLYRHRDRTVTAVMISRDTGLSVHFLYQFATGRYDCSVNRVTALYEYLAKKKLEVV